MFNKTPSQKPSEPTRRAPSGRSSAQAPSILGSDLIVTGEINTDGDVQIEGRLDGNIKAATITIGEKGFVNGKIIAGTVHVRGKVTGKIEADSVEIAESANVLADIVQDHLSIANGAFFDGKCTRKTATNSAPKVSLPPKK